MRCKPIVEALESPVLLALLGVDYGRPGVLYDVNTTTGATSNPRTMNISVVAGLTANASGTLYAISQSGSDSLHTVNPTNGSATLVGQLGFDIFEGILISTPQLAYSTELRKPPMGGNYSPSIRRPARGPSLDHWQIAAICRGWDDRSARTQHLRDVPSEV